MVNGTVIKSLRQLVRNCDIHHAACKGGKHNLKIPADFDMFLIDLVEFRLVPLVEGMRFVALSYVCGASPSFQNTRDRLDTLLVRNGLISIYSCLKKTIRDTLSLAAAFGERYVWTDSPCLIQETKTEQLRNLHHIYRMASYTIVAAEGPDGDAGLWSTRRDLIDATEPIADIIEQRRKVKKLPWSRRAWTLQEWLLSSRTMSVMSHVIVWHCSSKTFSVPLTQAKLPLARAKHSPISSNMWSHYFSSYTVKPLSSPMPCTQNLTRAWVLYQWTVAMHSGRRVRDTMDVLRAFHGLALTFEGLFGCPMVQGLPASLLPLALTWRRVGNEGHQRRQKTVPSWAWACGQRNVAYQSDSPTTINTDQFFKAASRSLALTSPSIAEARHLAIDSFTASNLFTPTTARCFEFHSETHEILARVYLDRKSKSLKSHSKLELLLLHPDLETQCGEDGTLSMTLEGSLSHQKQSSPTECLKMQDHYHVLAIETDLNGMRTERIGAGWTKRMWWHVSNGHRKSVVLH